METSSDDRSPQPEVGAHVASCVIRVTNLDRAAKFYCDVFSCRVSIREDDMALLLAPNGFQIYLHAGRTFRRRGLGTLGIAYLMWATDSQSDLQLIAQRLRAFDPAVFTHTENEVTFVEGRDPDGRRIVIAHPSPHRLSRRVIAEGFRG
jgi:extradiol dioxygenase family protein